MFLKNENKLYNFKNCIITNKQHKSHDSNAYLSDGSQLNILVSALWHIIIPGYLGQICIIFGVNLSGYLGRI